MNQRDEYKPKLPSDKDYIQGVASSIERKEQLEDVRFELLNNALIAVGVDEDPYVLVRADGFDADAIQRIADSAYEKINSGKLSDEVKEKVFALWDYLTEADPLQKADLIFVFGGGGTTRPVLAAQMYKEGWAPKILFTGRHASYMKDEHKSEAELFAEVAHENGVPTADIILEIEAKNTPENAINSVKLLKEQGVLPKSIILTQIEYQMRRAYLTFRAVANWKPELIRRPAPSAKFKRENFWTDKNGWSYVFLEYIKMYGARQMGHF